MLNFFKTYKAFLFGFAITWILIWIFDYFDFIMIDTTEYLTNFLGFLFYWVLISMPIHKFNYLKEHKKAVFKVIGLVVLFVVILVIDSNMNMPDNPLTLFLFIFFYLSIAYLISPGFIKKYSLSIIIYYCVTFIIFLYFRFYSESFELYRQNSKELFLLFIAPVPVFATLWAYQQWKWFKTLKAEKAKAELSMLQAQMDPHFFFNTLNNLYALTIKKSEKAPEVILKLSEMMRYTIYEGKKESVLVKDEIDYLLNYIELHKIRYKKKVDIQFTHNVEDNNAKIAPLLFIILLENAFKHGVESQSQDAFIHINLQQNENALSFEIKNNFDESEISKRKGIGLENLKRRLTLLFKESFIFEVSINGNIYTTILKVPLYA